MTAVFSLVGDLAAGKVILFLLFFSIYIYIYSLINIFIHLFIYCRDIQKNYQD